MESETLRKLFEKTADTPCASVVFATRSAFFRSALRLAIRTIDARVIRIIDVKAEQKNTKQESTRASQQA